MIFKACITHKEYRDMVKRRAELFDLWADDPKHKDHEEFRRLTEIIKWLAGR